MKVRLEFVPNDLWIGAFLKDREHEDYDDDGNYFIDEVVRHLYICIVPMFPIHFSWSVFDTCSEGEWHGSRWT